MHAWIGYLSIPLGFRKLGVMQNNSRGISLGITSLPKTGFYWQRYRSVVERYDLVKIELTESEAEHPFCLRTSEN